jgi:hypothetical protein
LRSIETHLASISSVVLRSMALCCNLLRPQHIDWF